MQTLQAALQAKGNVGVRQTLGRKVETDWLLGTATANSPTQVAWLDADVLLLESKKPGKHVPHVLATRPCEQSTRLMEAQLDGSLEQSSEPFMGPKQHDK